LTIVPEVKTAIVFSAGGMFGAYQAGVWSALCDAIQPDIVVGASIGSLNGWLVAAGKPAAELENLWLNLDHISRPRWRIPRSLRQGLIADEMDHLYQEVYQAGAPKSQYGVVLTETFRLRPRLFEWPDVTWEHLAASCSVPLFLPPRKINGVFYADGGLVDPLPLWAAVRMGATRIVAVNVLVQRPWFVRATVKAARGYSRYRGDVDPGIEIVTIEPKESLGAASDTLYWNRDRARRWIELGKKDSYASKHLVVECFERQ
jgi:predicted acylesterase/phospholipase RssA